MLMGTYKVMSKDNEFFEGLHNAMAEGLDALREGKPLTTREERIVVDKCPKCRAQFTATTSAAGYITDRYECGTELQYSPNKEGYATVIGFRCLDNQLSQAKEYIAELEADGDI